MSPRLSVLAILLALATAPPMSAQQTPARPPLDRSQKLAFDPLVTVGTLDNGLRYYIMANRLPEKRAELRLAVNVGSVFEDDDQRGLAHFVEHMAFNGTKHFPKNDLVKYLQSIGMRFGADLNAYTSFDETVYMLQVPTDSGKFLATGIEILGDWAGGVTFDSAEVEAERGVVGEEWRLRRGAGARMQDQQFPTLLKGSKYADRMVIGTIDHLKNFKHASLRRFYQQWYRPDMMAVVAVGDFDKAEVERLIRARFSQLPARSAMARPAFPVPPHDSTYITIATDREATNSSFSIYNVLPRRDMSTLGAFRDRYVERLGLDMLNARMSEITQKPNPPFAAAGASRGYFIRAADTYSVFGGVKEGGLLPGFEAVLTEIERAARFGFSDSELQRAKASRLRNQEMLMANKDKHYSAERASELLRNFLQQEDVLGTEAEYNMYVQIVPTVTLAEVNQVTRAMLAGQNRVITVNAPDKAGANVPTEAQFLAVMQAVKAKQLEPYKDNVVTGPLIAKLPTPGAILSTQVLADLNVTEWKLANGVRVVLKPTDYMADEIILTGTSPGGTSLVPDSLFISASLASTIASAGGVGNYNAVDLRKLLTGKAASAYASIGARSESVGGNATRKDLETMFQLVYLRFTAVRPDSSAFIAFKQSMQASMANADASPLKAFSDTVQVTMSQNNLRARPISGSTLDEVNFNRALAIYRDRFADASDFTFTIVGNFDVDSIKPLVERYLGGLPSLNRKEAPRDLGIRPPTGVIDKVVRRGVEPQSQTFMAFSGPYQYSAENDYLLASLSEVLTNRLIEKIREKLGGTYGVSARITGSRDDSKVFTATISFGSAPERSAELEQAVLAEIKSLRESGPTAEELTKVKEAQIRTREINLKSNFFWVSQLSTAYQYGEDPRSILGYRKLVDGLTTESLRAAAQRFLKGDNYVHVTLLPNVVTP
ncbi:MAG: insulinase family protein [Gemmatimonadales bacterium]